MCFWLDVCWRSVRAIVCHSAKSVNLIWNGKLCVYAFWLALACSVCPFARRCACVWMSFWYCARIVHTFLSYKFLNIVNLIAFDLLTKRRAFGTRHFFFPLLVYTSHLHYCTQLAWCLAARYINILTFDRRVKANKGSKFFILFWLFVGLILFSFSFYCSSTHNYANSTVMAWAHN